MSGVNSEELKDSSADAVEQLALKLERLGLALPAMIFIEASKPLHRLALHAFDFFPSMPITHELPLLTSLKSILQNSAAAELLIARLERGARS